MMETAREPRPDEDLVRQAANGDREAMDLLVRRHHGAVYRTALAIVGDEDQAQDVAQETFIKVVRAIRRFRGDSSFRTWVLSIAANEARGQFRGKRRRVERPLDDALEQGTDDPDVVQRISVTRDADRARTLLGSLPRKQRMAVSLRLFEGLNFREVGELIDSSEGAARVNYHHGIRRLRELMEDG